MKEGSKTFDFGSGGLKSSMTKHGKAVANLPDEVPQLTAMWPLFTPALWPNALDKTLLCWSPIPEQRGPSCRWMVPHTPLPGHFFLHRPFRQTALDPSGGRGLGKGGAHATAWWICPRNCRGDLGKALWAVIQRCSGEVQQQQRAWLSARETRLLFDLCFCFPSCETAKEMSPLSRLTFASELIFAEYSELPRWWRCKPHSLTPLSPIGRSHAGLGI